MLVQERERYEGDGKDSISVLVIALFYVRILRCFAISHFRFLIPHIASLFFHIPTAWNTRGVCLCHGSEASSNVASSSSDSTNPSPTNLAEGIVLSASAVIADWLTAVVCTDEEGGYHRANPSNTAAGLDLEDFSNERYGDGDLDGGYNYNYTH